MAASYHMELLVNLWIRARDAPIALKPCLSSITLYAFEMHESLLFFFPALCLFLPLDHSVKDFRFGVSRVSVIKK